MHFNCTTPWTHFLYYTHGSPRSTEIILDDKPTVR